MSTYHHAVERTIYVGNIGHGVTEQALLALFGHCGTVTQIRLAGDPSFETRYAFIEFSVPEEARTALLLDGMQVYERPIRVSPARGGGPLRNNDPDRVNKTIHVAGIPLEDIEENVLADFFSHCGEVVAVRKSGRFAWVEFATVPGMQAALGLDGEPLGNGIMKVQQSRTPIMNAGWRAQPKESSSLERPPPFAMPSTTADPLPSGGYNGHYGYASPCYPNMYGNGYGFNCAHASGDMYGNALPHGVMPNAFHGCPQDVGPAGAHATAPRMPYAPPQQGSIPLPQATNASPGALMGNGPAPSSNSGW